MEEFIQFYGEESEAAEEAYPCAEAGQGDFSAVSADGAGEPDVFREECGACSAWKQFGSGALHCHLFREEEGLFQRRGCTVDDGLGRRPVCGRRGFEGRYGRLTCPPEDLQEAFFAEAFPGGEQDDKALDRVDSGFEKDAVAKNSAVETSGAGECSAGEDVIGVGFLEDCRRRTVYVMAARWAEENSGDVAVTVYDSGRQWKYRVEMGRVDVQNATEIEMFGLCSYLDAVGAGVQGKFGTWQTLRYFQYIAVFHGYFQIADSLRHSASLRQNWFLMVRRVTADSERGGLEEQVRDGRALSAIFAQRQLSGASAVHTAELTLPAKREEAVTDDGLLLVNETSQCSYPSSEEEQQEIHYVVCYTRQEILCKRAGQPGAIWRLPYRSKRDYGSVMGFLRQFSAHENLRFAAHKNFWQDYLSGNADEKVFLDFFCRWENGIPNYLLTTEEGIFADFESLRYQEYFAQNFITDPPVGPVWERR